MVTNPMDDLIPGKEHISVFIKLREPGKNLEGFDGIIDKMRGMPSHYISSLKVDATTTSGAIWLFDKGFKVRSCLSTKL